MCLLSFFITNISGWAMQCEDLTDPTICHSAERLKLNATEGQLISTMTSFWHAFLDNMLLSLYSQLYLLALISS